MENSKNSEINVAIPDILDIRQSPQWAEYLASLGWQSTRSSNGTNIEIIKSAFGAVAKIQRPVKLTSADLQEIEDILNKNKCTLAKIEPSLTQDLQVLKNAGFTRSNAPNIPPSTIYIDLRKTKDELWEKISHSGKYKINRAQREGTKIEYLKNPKKAVLELFYQMEIETGTKKRFYIQNLHDLNKKIEVFGNNSHLLFSYDSKGTICGGNLYLGFNNNIWFIHGATTETGRKTRAGYELVWKAFLYLKKQGYTILDLEGRDDDRYRDFTKDWGGFSHFKEKFGGINVQFPETMIKFYNPILKKIAMLSPKFPI